MTTRTSRPLFAARSTRRTLLRGVLAAAAGAMICCVLSFYQATEAAPPTGNQPFANSVQQRMDMISELSAIHALMKEQNSLLKKQNELLRTLVTGVVPNDQAPRGGR